MTTNYRLAAIQMRSKMDKSANIACAKELIGCAISQGVKLVALPEMFNCLGAYSEMVLLAETIPGETTEWLSALAQENSIYIHCGSIYEKDQNSERVYNTSCIIGPTGNILTRYQKIHLFDVDLPDDFSSLESNWITAGDIVVVSDTDLGKIGMSVCYDLRFPELYRRLSKQGAELLFVPAAFRATTGAAHWEVLLRARAIENQAYVIAPNQWGDHEDNLSNYGNSMIVNPWGEIIARAENKEDAVLIAEIDLLNLKKIREHLPALDHRQIDVS